MHIEALLSKSLGETGLQFPVEVDSFAIIEVTQEAPAFRESDLTDSPIDLHSGMGRLEDLRRACYRLLDPKP